MKKTLLAALFMSSMAFASDDIITCEMLDSSVTPFVLQTVTSSSKVISGKPTFIELIGKRFVSSVLIGNDNKVNVVIFDKEKTKPTDMPKITEIQMSLTPNLDFVLNAESDNGGFASVSCRYGE